MNTYIWDLDGTLIDSYGVIVPSLIEACREVSIQVDKEWASDYVIEFSVGKLLRKLAEEHSVDVADLKARCNRISGEMNVNITAERHAEEMLRGLSLRGDRNFVYTHRGESSFPILKRLGLDGYFEEIVTSNNGFEVKPSPDAVNYLIEKYGLDRDSTYYVGDRTIDMQCAANAGIKGILYLPKNSRCKPDGSEKFTVGDLADIITIR